METLGRARYVELLEQDYDVCFDGTHALVYLHIDNLKHYNRIHGVEAGDRVLHSMVRWASRKARKGQVARYAGDGIVFLVDKGAVDALGEQANSVLPTFGEVNGLQAKIGTMACQRPMGVDEVMHRILFACSSIEDVEGVYSCAFEGDVKLRYDRRSYIVDHLDDAIARGEIQAWAQPIVRVLTGRICEVEMLARWQSERYGFLYPDEFIPVLEQHELIHKLDLEVIRLACAQWAEARTCGTNVPLGVNLSRLDFELCDIVDEIRTIADEYGMPHELLAVEVTESTLSGGYEFLKHDIERLRDAYRVDRVVPVDMFPHTKHVETVVLMSRKDT